MHDTVADALTITNYEPDADERQVGVVDVRAVDWGDITVALLRTADGRHAVGRWQSGSAAYRLATARANARRALGITWWEQRA